MEDAFAIRWERIWDIALTAPLIYILVIVYIRVIGKRSTSRMNSFDWIVTVAMGSLTASTIILDDVSVVEGAFSILLMLFFQYLLTAGVTRFEWAKEFIQTKPRLLLLQGEFLHDNMKDERVLESEVFAAIRQAGHKSTKDVYAVVLETNANLSVLSGKETATGLAMVDVEGIPESLQRDIDRIRDEDDFEAALMS